MTGLSRRGACPTLSQPMQTGDGLIVRLNPIAGGFSPNALIGLCESARRHGNGIMEVTARGSLQIRGLTPESAPALAREMDALGIAIRTGVPVETGPLAGLDSSEIADPRPLAERVRAAIAKAGLTARLGPKVSVVIDGGGRIGLGGVLADIRLAAARAGDRVVWRLAAGGDGATARPLADIAEADVCTTVLAILEAVASLGRQGRARNLDAARLAALGLPGAQDAARRGRDDGAPAHVPLDIFDLQDGACALGLGLPFGAMPAEAIAALAGQAAACGATEIRPCPGRALLVLDLSPVPAPLLRDAAATLGFLTDPGDPRAHIAACPGRPACASGRIATRDIASAIAATDADLLDGSLMLHVSGCAKGCAHPGAAALTLTGSDDGAGLVVDATAKALPAAMAAGHEAAAGLSRVAALVRRARRPDETSAGCLARLGAAEITKAFAQE